MINIGYENTMNKPGKGIISPLKCWEAAGYTRVPGTKEFSKGSCEKK
jgi:hypothetical protein